MKQKLLLMVVLFFTTALQMMAGGTTTYFYTTKVVASGNGVIYASETNTEPSDGSYGAEMSVGTSTTTSSGSKTFYLWAKPTADFTTVSWTGNHDNIAITTTGDYTATAVVKGVDYNNANFTITANFITKTAAEKPVIAGADGATSYWPSLQVTITSPEEGAVIYYTTDGTDPTTASARYTGPITISEPNGTATTVKAIAQIAGFDVSEVATATFTSSQPLADTPVINNADGQDKFWPTTTVTITSAQEGAVIYYTTDGSAPTTASTRYTGPITLSNTAVVKAIAVVNGYANSVVAEKSFMLSDPALEPRTVTHMFNDQTIYGSQPALQFFFDKSEQEFLATKVAAFGNYADNQILGRVLPLNADIQVGFEYDPTVFTGTFDINRIPHTANAVTAQTRRLYFDGDKAEGQRPKMVFSSPTGSKIKKVTVFKGLYGSNPHSYAPREVSTVITLPVDGVQSSVTWASATTDFIWEGETSSLTLESTSGGYGYWYILGFQVEYMQNLSAAAAPDITGDENPFLFERIVTLSTPDEGASIYYTTDGSEPTENSTLYSKPFTLTETATVKAMAVLEGKDNSVVSSRTFTKQATVENIRTVRQNGTAGMQYITLNDAVVTWVSAAGDSITIQDNSAEQYSGIMLVQPVTAIGKYLELNNHLNGIVYGNYSAARGELSGFQFYNSLPEITPGNDAPFASVSLGDIKAPAGNQSSGGETPYDNMAYLNQLVKYKVVVNTLATKDWDDDGTYDYKVVNALNAEDVDVQIYLPPTNDVVVNTGEEYAFTGVLTNITQKVKQGTLYYMRPFRTLRVPTVAYLTDASGRTMSTFELERDHYRFVSGDEVVGDGQITVRTQSRPGTFTYESSNPSVVSVNATTGAIKPLAIGTATITVTLTETDDYAAASREVSVSVVGPTYQLTNGDFEAWANKSGSYYRTQNEGTTGMYGSTGTRSQLVPNEFDSWLTGVFFSENSELCRWKYWTLPAGLQRVTDVHEGGSGQYAVKISEGETNIAAAEGQEAYTIKVPGRLTNGSIFVDQFLNASTQLYGLQELYNFVYSDYSEEDLYSTFTGIPDAVSLWVKGKSATKPVVNVALHSEGMYIYGQGEPGLTPEDFGAWNGELIAQAYQELPGDETWQEVVVPFNYVRDERPTMALTFFSTSTRMDNAETGDYLIFDDLKFVYNSELETATFEGVAFEFDENGAATIQGDYDESKLALTSNGRAATIETAYDATTRVLTITVKGDDFSVNPDNQHVYTVTFEEASAMEVEHETTITIDGAGATEVLTEDVTYTAVIANAANGNKNITLKNIEAWYLGMLPLIVGDLVIANVAVGEDGTLDGSNATFTVVSEEGEEQMEGTILSGTLSTDDMTGVFKVVHTSLGVPLDLTIYFGVPREGYSYTRTVTPGRYGTITLPFAVAADGMEGVKAVYSVAGYVAKNGKPSSLVLKEETQMQAGYPYVFLPTATEVTFSAPTTAAYSSFALFSNGFYGSYTRVEMDNEKAYISDGATIYLLSSNKLVKAGSGSYIDGNRGYFLLNDPMNESVPEITETQAAGVKGVRFNFDNTATGISELSLDDTDAVIYNVAGQRLQRTAKGVNIVNGRKVVKK